MKMIDGLDSRAIVKSCFTSLKEKRRQKSPCKKLRASAAHLSLSPIHLLTKSELLTLKNVLFASVATALARKDLPVPGGPYIRIPLQGVRFPVNSCGNLIGKMTASFNASFAVSSPATSSHLTFGVSDKMAPVQ